MDFRTKVIKTGSLKANLFKFVVRSVIPTLIYSNRLIIAFPLHLTYLYLIS